MIDAYAVELAKFTFVCSQRNENTYKFSSDVQINDKMIFLCRDAEVKIKQTRQSIII